MCANIKFQVDAHVLKLRLHTRCVPKRESKVAKRRRNGPQGTAGTALKLGLFLRFSPTRPKASPRPNQARPRLPKGCQKYFKSLTKYEKTLLDHTNTTHEQTVSSAHNTRKL